MHNVSIRRMRTRRNGETRTKWAEGYLYRGDSGTPRCVGVTEGALESIRLNVFDDALCALEMVLRGRQTRRRPLIRVSVIETWRDFVEIKVREITH